MGFHFWFFDVGYSGEDQPRSIIPSCLGVLEGDAAAKKINGAPAAEDAEMGDGAAPEESKVQQPQMRYISGRTEIGMMREHMKIKPLYEEAGTSKYFDL